MPIGQRMGNLKTLKKTLAKGGSGGAWIKYIPKNSSMNVRFIQEPEEWVNYVEHYDQTIRKSYPCNSEASCPGCATGERKSNRYLANAVDVDSDRVIPLQMPKDLANRLVVRYERNGTMTDRDFELSRAGEGLDTTYDLDAGAVDRRKIDKYTPLDLIKVLEDAYAEVFGADVEDADDDDDADEVEPVKITGTVKQRAKSKAVQALDEDDDEEEVAPPKAAAKKLAKKAAKSEKAPEPVFTPDVDDDDDTDTDAEPDVDDDDEGYDEETLKALPLGALRAVAREFGIDPKGKDEDEIIDLILESGEPVGDEPPF